TLDRSICPPVTDQPQPAAVRSIQMWPGASRPSCPSERLASCTDTLSSACRSSAGTPAAGQDLPAWASSGWSCAPVRPASAPGPLDVAWSACPSVMVMMTVEEVIGWPLLKLSALTLAVLLRVTWQVWKFGPSTKSESVADGLCEERVSARKLVKQGLRP